MKYLCSYKVYLSIFSKPSAKVLIALFFSTGSIQLYAQNMWFKGNTHAHTLNSDGNLSPTGLADKYQSAGYQFLFITDHNFVTPVEGLSAPGFLCMTGEEITFGRHFNGLGIERFISPISGQYSIDSVQGQGSIPTLNHPVWPPTRVCVQEILDMDGLDYIEIHNALTESWGFHDNQMLWDSLLTSGRLIYGIASDDAHYSEHIGKGWLMVWSGVLTKDSLLESIKKGSFYSSTGITFSEISVTQTKIKIASTNASTIKFIGEGGKLLKISSGNTSEYTITGQELYIRIEVSNDLGEKAWTQPLVWNNSFGGKVTGGSTINIGQPTEMLSLVDFEGTVDRWQRKLNNENWATISSTASRTYRDVPQTIGTWKYRAEVCRGDVKTWSKPAVVNVLFDAASIANFGVLLDSFVYPNPTPDYLYILWPACMMFTKYDVIEISGKMVLSGKLSPNPFGQSKIDLLSLKKGIYLIKLYGVSIDRIVKVVKK